MKKIIFTTALLAFSATASANPTVVASGEGWCKPDECNNINSNSISNTFAGDLDIGSVSHNWFAFNIPILGTISSASLNIWNENSNYNYNPSAIYNVHSASGFNFTDLVSGNILGSISVGDASNGTSRYVNIFFNTQGISFLNISQGSQVVFGGDIVGSDVQLFGYTNGYPLASLDLIAAVPEPETYAILFLGLGLVGLVARRKSNK